MNGKNMTSFESIFKVSNTAETGLPDKVFVFARTGELDGLGSLADTVSLVEIEPGEMLPDACIAQAHIAVVEVDPADSRSIARLDALRRMRPHLPVIAALSRVDLNVTRLLLRKGIGDVVEMPFTVDDLLTAILDVEREIGASAQQDVALAPVIAVQKCHGGAGATTIATHLGDAIAREMGEACRACIIDLDLQSGDVASYFDSSSRQTLLDLVEAGSRLDDELMQAVATEATSASDIISAPAEIQPIEELKLAGLQQVIAMARRRYDIVIFDMPGALTNWAMSVMLAADAVLLVGHESISALRQVKRKLRLLQDMDYHASRVAIALNNSASGLFKKVDRRGIEDALGHRISAIIASDPQLIEQAQTQGVLARRIQRKNRFTSDIEKLADDLLNLLEREQ
ncbi:AAA family ATPase [Qipengyuania sp. 1XM1-15A]|uniref:AAA family ATPase n=1 Tax=Qipengyuania xiamenensis TaxID=2867237 RepID=UPI001C86E084|nr:AAA family ATPase [Qipengyuania xiamenensis]MBX7533723.1 AAA family ATPase [Qipengyuania xiamenensis]